MRVEDEMQNLRRYLVIAVLTALSSSVLGQAPRSIVRGVVTDPDDAVIPGAAVVLKNSSGQSLVATSQSDGTFRLDAVPAGVYTLTITMHGFANFISQGIHVIPPHEVVLRAKMGIQKDLQQVEVADQSNTLSMDQDAHASATTIRGNDLDSLSDDPDDLASELMALAGPADGPNGGTMYIDGFTGGRLPPKTSIREIRINQSPFSAQYDQTGAGRVEVFTKPGTKRFHGSFQVNGNQKSLNTGNPLLNAFLTAGQPTEQQPPYYTVLAIGSLTGPVTPRSSFALFGTSRVIRDNNLVSATVPNAIFDCPSGQVTCNYSVAFPEPQSFLDMSSRFDSQISNNNSFMIRVEYQQDKRSNRGVGGLILPSAGLNTSSSEGTVQSSDTQIINSHMVNEIRAEVQRDSLQKTALATSPGVTVSGNFIAGGANSGKSSDHQIHLEFQDYLAVQLKTHFLRLGGRLRSTRDANSTTAGSNGLFVYSCLTTDSCNADESGRISSYANGLAEQFSITTNNRPVSGTLTDLGLYAEDEWKIRPNLEFSYGIRYETQNHLADHHDFAPRLSFAYGLGKVKGTPKTVVRGGVGIFYDRFLLASYMTTVRQNGVNQIQTIIDDPNPACNPNNLGACSGESNGNTTYSEASNLRSPYTLLLALGADRQLMRGVTLSLTLGHSRGLHQFYSENTNAPHNGVYPIPPSGSGLASVPYQYESGGVFNQTHLEVNINARIGRTLSLYGYDFVNFAKSDTGGPTTFPSVPGHIAADYGRAIFDVRNRVYVGGSLSLPLAFTLSSTVVAWSGAPYNVTLGSDFNKDSIYNDRPMFLPGRGGANCSDASSFGRPASNIGYTPIPINYCTGPSLFVTYMRLVKNFGFGPKDESSKSTGRGSDTGRRYNVSFGAQFQNLFNDANLGPPQGVLISPQFGRSTQLAGSPFASSSALRRIYLQSSISF
jgi:hypothetical protein